MLRARGSDSSLAGTVRFKALIVALASCVSIAVALTGTEVIEVQMGESIQAAIDAAPDGATIRLAPGLYRENIIISKPLRLVGSGRSPSMTRIHAVVSQEVSTLTITGDADVVVENLVVDRSRKLFPDAVAVLGSGNVTLRGLEVLGSRSNGISIHSTGTVEIRECWIHTNMGNGIDVQSPGTVEVWDCVIGLNAGFGIVVQTAGAAVSGGGNDLRGNGAELGFFAPSELRTVLVEQTDATHVRVPWDYETIQEAIDAVAPGGIVEIAEGVFPQALTIWKSLTIRGQGADETKLETPKMALWLYGGVVLHEVESLIVEQIALKRPWVLVGPEASLQDVDVWCTASRYGLDDVGIELLGSAVAEFNSVRFREIEGVGLRVMESANVSMRGCLFERCDLGILVEDAGTIDLIGCDFLQMEGLALEVQSGDVHLSSCVIRGGEESGVAVYGGALFAQDCVIAESEGLAANGEVYVELVDCVITENITGVRVTDGAQVDLAGCAIDGNHGEGAVAMMGGRMDLTDCTITDNGHGSDRWSTDGVSVLKSSYVRMSGCSVGRNRGDGIRVGRPVLGSSPPGTERDEVYMDECRVFENGDSGLSILGWCRVEATNTALEQNAGHGIWIFPSILEGGIVVKLTDCTIAGHLGTGISIEGYTDVRLERCMIVRNAESGVVVEVGGWAVSESLKIRLHACSISENSTGVLLTGSPSVELADCQITSNLGYGLQIYGEGCGGDQGAYDPDLRFTGELTGSGNVIPDGSGLDGNSLGGICPAGEWDFLLEGAAPGQGV